MQSRQQEAPRGGSLGRQEALWFFVFLAPWLVGFVSLSLYPILASAYFSFTQYSVLQSPRWIGLANYANLFFQDPLFWHSLQVTLLYAVSSVPLQLILAFVCAVLLNVRLPGMRFLRTIYYVPTVLPLAATSMLWLFLFLPGYGLINWLLRVLVRLDGPDWLGDPNWALPALVLMSLWSIGSALIIFLAGLQAIPPELYEAADLDGVSIWTRAWHITLPMVSPVVLLNLILGLIGASQTFVQVYIMTQGGPDYATYFYNLYLYRNAFAYFKMGLASAQAWVLLVVILVLTATVFQSSARWVYYGGER